MAVLEDKSMQLELSPVQTPDANVTKMPTGWRLSIPAGPARAYRLAQLDDYARTSRSRLRHAAPRTFSLRARISEADLPGTWGFGFWNDPFGLSLGFGMTNPMRLPALPQTAWFMHASTPNWLSLQPGQAPAKEPDLPANGFFAGTFRSPRLSPLLFLPALPGMPLLLIRPVSRLIRRLAGRIIQQEAVRVSTDVSDWHSYTIHWTEHDCRFSVDGKEILSTACSPRPPLGLVIWIDNQYAAWTPAGRLAYGTLANPAAWMEIEGLSL
jgi:hypothetical protein